MAKVSLRIYNREIESLIDQGQNDEAIAHCLHILKTFPKHLETYRLLGKGFLEAKRYNEAVDIFSRLLVCVPDDFVAHVGMSIINDEQGKLDNAIWHMERAFEAQPSNAAIQGELQRLYGRRDGMEPPKIRMTRGSLANMYVKGELYAQAIAEIRGVLANDPKRTDMQILLAKALFKSGQKADASDMCNQLLKISPYCLEANRIMMELVPTTAGAESTQVYRTHVVELDPYAAFAQGSVYRSNEVSDAAVGLDRLDYRPEDAMPMTQNWGSSLGIGLAAPSFSSTDEQPDWLKSASSASSAFDVSATDETLPSMSKPAPAQAASDNIPDFLRDAGWGNSTGPEQPYSLGDESASDSDGPLAPADMPDWMKSMAPPTDTLAPANDASVSDDGAAWFAGLQAAASGATSSSPDIFDEPVSMNANAQSDTPDWLSGTDSSPASVSNDNNMDWLSSLGGNEPIAATSSNDAPDWPSGETSSATPTQDDLGGDMPDWLRGSSSAPAQSAKPAPAPSAQEQDDAIGWLESLASKHGAKPEELVTDPNKRSDKAPDWVSQSQQQPAMSQPSAPPSAQEQDDAVAWLESLATKHGAKPEELVTDPNKRSDKAPDWVSKSQPQPIASQPSEPVPPSAQEQDDAIAWLESLASKHGAKPEELVTDPNKRSDKAPDWVSQSQQQPPPAAAQSSVPTPPTPQEQDDAVAWLESLASKHGAKPEELVTDPSKRSDKAPDWVSQSQQPPAPQADTSPPNAQNIGEQFFTDFEEKDSTQSSTDTTGMWLRNLDDEKKPEPQQADTWSPNAKNIGEQFFADFEKEEASSSTMGDTSAWLKSLEADDQPSAAPQKAQVSPGAKNIGEQFFADFEDSHKEESTSSDKGVTDWLAGLDDDLTKATQQPSLDKLDEWTPPVTSKPEPVYVDDPFAKTGSKPSADLPTWLNDDFTDEQVTEAQDSDEGLPDWLKGSGQAKGQGESNLKPTKPTGWKPVEKKAEAQLSASTSMPARSTSSQPVYQTGPARDDMEEETSMPAPRAKGTSARSAGSRVNTRSAEKAAQGNSALDQAQGELSRGDIPGAVEHYKKLIKKGKNLDEAIHDLRDALYRYPVEVSIWQTLGDAYMRANRLQEALDAYTKAEELLR